MKKLSILAITFATIMAPTVANATPTIDGNYDVDYGLAKSVVAYDPAAPTSNFGSPTPFSNTTSYSIYLTSDANYVYGFLKSLTPTGLPFANLYFDLNPSVGDGSDLGFEITNDQAFIPGVPGYSAALAGLTFAVSGDGTGIEFALSNSLFTSAIAGLNYSNYVGALPTIGSDITLRLSQSFGYSVAGGATYGDDRLGRVTLGGNAVAGVPEPATWAMLMLGFGAVGGMLRRKRKQIRVRYA